MTEGARKAADQAADGQPEKLDLRSHDITVGKREELLRLFPEARTENGKIDLERLRLALGDTVDVGKERYGLSWPGKADCFKAIQTPSLGTLRPCPDESVDFDTTENLIIEGDNLEVLKLLQKSYLGKVKLIYIDPPYNTGNDFIYPDDYTETLQTYLEYTGQVDDEGKRFGTNTDTDGRFHSKWLSMMYPRLYLARNLLCDDGAIFITIDDRELANLRRIMDEIFGEENFVAQIEWQKRYTRSNNTDGFTSVIDHVLLYGRSEMFQPQLLERDEVADSRYRNPDNDPRGPWKAIPFLNPLSPSERPNLAYPIQHPSGRTIKPTRKAWRSERRVWERLVKEGRVWWGKDDSSDVPSIKRYLSEVRGGMTPINFWSHEFAGHTDAANQEVKTLLGDKVFDTLKPTRLVQRMIQLVCTRDEEDIVLDFFAGSGTTAHAVVDLNSREGTRHKFILVQLPEPTNRDEFRTIADITKARVRRAIEKVKESKRDQLSFDGDSDPDLGFRVFKLGESNFKTWEAEQPTDAKDLERQLDLHVNHIRGDRSEGDLLYELLLKSGFPLATSIEELKVEGKIVYRIADGSLLICLDRKLNLELIRALAAMKPARVVCLDAGFQGDDPLKANAVQIFRTQGVASFKTA